MDGGDTGKSHLQNLFLRYRRKCLKQHVVVKYSYSGYKVFFHEQGVLKVHSQCK